MATNTWLGGNGAAAQKTDWTRGKNWSSGNAPAATDDIVIPGGTNDEPVISAAGNLNISSLTLHNGGSLTFTSSGQR